MNNDIERRVERLERAIWWWKFAAVVLFALIFVSLLVFRTTPILPSLFIHDGITLTDEGNRPRIFLKVLNDQGHLWLGDEDSRSRIGLAEVKEGSLISLFDDQGRIRVMLGVRGPRGPEGQSQGFLTFIDEEGHKVLELPESTG